MPLPADFHLNPNEFGLHFETNGEIDARRLAAVLAATAVEAQRWSGFAGNQIALRSLRSGSPTTVTWEIIGPLADLATLALFVDTLVRMALHDTRSAFSRRLAELLDEDEVPIAEGLYLDPMQGRLVREPIYREQAAAVHQLRDARDRDERADGLEYITDEKGHIITTEEGEPLVSERPARPPEHANRSLANVGSDWMPIPRSSLPKGQPMMEGNFVGQFRFDEPPFYTFRSDTGETFQVRGIGMDIELPTGMPLIVRGAITDDGARTMLLYPQRIMRIGPAH